MLINLALTLTVLAIALAHLFFLGKKKKIADITTTGTATISTIITNSRIQPLPPSPPQFPIIDNLHQLGSLPHHSLRSLSDQHGPLMLHLGCCPALAVSSPCVLRGIIQTHDHLFSKSPFLKVPDTLFYHSQDIGFAPYGEYWREIKKVTILHLFSNEKVGSYKQVREEEVAFMMKEFERTTMVEMIERFNALSRDVISRTVIGKAARRRWWGAELRILIDNILSKYVECLFL
ncbi:cytochrome P450 71A21-like [Phalaenopsis equestris]|uniref:cytochrome P450 71A21-like n=1 Tax=Phalaenopsis equestris TaxID=78828 RepID=UPI0009E560DE|nr:cytochrome P450 71A21-like [Phalaenopsis equestris]